MEPVRFVAIGELLVDVLAQGTGHDARIRVGAGGSALNAATAAAAAGADATVIATVGDDPAGQMILAELAARGIRAEVSVAEGPTGTFLLTDDGIHVDPGVAHAIVCPEGIDADAVLVSGYLEAKTLEAALACAHAPWVALDAARLERLPTGGNAVFVNEEGARRLTGAAPEEAAARLARGRRLACVTLGPRGAIAVSGGRVERAEPTAQAVDAPGAGDAFAGRLLVELASGTPAKQALASACQAALDSLV